MGEVSDMLYSLVVDHLGRDARQLNNQLYFRCPGDGDCFNWHRDTTFRTKEPTDYLQTLIAVDPMTDNGNIMFFKGSHLVEDYYAADKEHVRQAPKNTGGPHHTFYCEPGDVLIWDVRTVHASLPNESNSMRMTYMNGFGVTDDEKWPVYLKDGVLQEIKGPLW
jgi:ectoine hydroxylase-related dioxygenase (phytanoyl-CoA dioxygenase family)